MTRWSLSAAIGSLPLAVAFAPFAMAQPVPGEQSRPSVAARIWEARFSYMVLPADYAGIREAVWRRWKPPAHAGHGCFATLEKPGDRFGISTFNLDADNRFVSLRYPLGDLNPDLDLAEKGSFEIISFDDLRAQVRPELFDSVKIVHRAAAFDTDFDPIRLVRAVNGLHSLGKDGALQAVSEYARLCDRVTDRWKYDLKPERIYLIARLLFTPAEGAPPFPSAWRPPWDTSDGFAINEGWPMFPLAVEGDVPFLVLEWSKAQGFKAPAPSWIEYCRDYGDFRAKPLCPTDPLAAAQDVLDRGIFGALEHDPEWKGYAILRAKSDLRHQVAEALSTVAAATDAFPLWQGEPGEVQPSREEYETVWQTYEARVRGLGPVWNEQSQDFVIPDLVNGPQR